MDHRKATEQGFRSATPRGSAVDHIGLTVNDLAASVSFYRDVIGMEVPMGTLQTGGDWFDTLTWNSGAAIDVAHLRLGGTTLQLVQYRAGGRGRSVTGHSLVGNVHLCITVPDVEAIHRDIVGSGAHRPTAIVDIPRTGVRSIYVEDPDGVPVELLQPEAQPFMGEQPDAGADGEGWPAADTEEGAR